MTTTKERKRKNKSRRGKGKHGRSRSQQKADFVVEDLRDLLPQLEKRFGIACD